MLSDLVMILVFVALLVASGYGVRTKYRIPAIFVLYLSILSLCFLLVTNFSMFFSPFTPKHHGRVIDAETQKPLAGVNIKAGWHVSSASVGGSSGEYYKIYKTKTDANGNFVIPRGVKALTIYTPVSKTSFEKVILSIYPENYQYQVERTHYIAENESIIALKKVKTDKEFLDNILAYYYGLFLMHKGFGPLISDTNEIEWLKNAYFIFEKTYKSNNDEEYLIKIANMLTAIKQPECIYIMQKMIDKYPNNATLSWFAENNINVYRKLYNSNANISDGVR